MNHRKLVLSVSSSGRANGNFIFKNNKLIGLKATEIYIRKSSSPNCRQQRQRILQQMYGFDIPLKALSLEKKSQTEQTSQKNTAKQKTTQHRSNVDSVL